MDIADVVIYDRLSNPPANAKTIIGAIGLKVSWALSEPGLLAFDVRVKDLVAIGLNPATLEGKWIKYTHPTAGVWGGTVTNLVNQDDIISVGGESWLVGLRGCLCDGGLADSNGGFNANMKRQLDRYKALTGVGYGAGTASDPATINISSDFGPDGWPEGADLLDQQLPQAMDLAWENRAYNPSQYTNELRVPAFDVDATTRKLRVADRYGTDRSATVKLADRVDSTGSTWSDDLSDVINTVTVHALTQTEHDGKCLQYKKCKKKNKTKCPCLKREKIITVGADTATGTNTTSRNAFGPRGATLTIDRNFTTHALLQEHANKRASVYSTNYQLVTIAVADSTPSKWGSFNVGDVISVDLANGGVKGKIVVRHKAIDVAVGQMVVSGEGFIS